MMQLTKKQYQNCWDTFINLGEDALYLSHYQLAQQTEITDAFVWKEFLIDPRTTEYINTEMNIIRTSAINSMIAKAPNSNSVGQSQLINALNKIDEQTAKKEGPVFIYCYVPLNEEQKYAPNVRNIDVSDIIKTEDGEYIINV